MSMDEFGKKMQDDIMSGVMKLLDDPEIESSAKLLETMAQGLEDGIATGVELPPELVAQIDVIREMQDLTTQTQAALAAGDHEAALALSQSVSALGGWPRTDYVPLPDIFHAVEMGDVAAVQGGLAEWEVNMGHGEFSETLLYHAMAPCGVDPSFDMMHALLDAGADPRLGLGAANGVLHGLGFGYYKPDTVSDLVKVIARCVSLGADIEERTSHLGWTPLMSALNEWNAPVTEALLRVGADPNARCADDVNGCTVGQTALEQVISEVALFTLLLDHGADPTQPCSGGANIRTVLEHYLAEASEDEWEDGLRACLAALDARKRQ